MKILIILSLMIASIGVFAHGGGKPGPHGGHIQMPGSFHTELVLEEKLAKVYLLDVQFKDPITAKSSVSLIAYSKDKNEKVTCLDKKIYFECRLPQHLSNYSSLGIKAARNSVIGKEALYALPLTFAKPEKPHH